MEGVAREVEALLDLDANVLRLEIDKPSTCRGLTLAHDLATWRRRVGGRGSGGAMREGWIGARGFGLGMAFGSGAPFPLAISSGRASPGEGFQALRQLLRSSREDLSAPAGPGTGGGAGGVAC